MNAQGETWTAEHVPLYRRAGSNRKELMERVYSAAYALADYRNQPEEIMDRRFADLIFAATLYSNDIKFTNEILGMAGEIVGGVARAHALSCEKRELPTTD